jgi:hypothetical protein
MLKSAFHRSEAVNCRTLAASLTDLHVRTVLSRMATLYEGLAARAAKTEIAHSAAD